MSEKNSTHLWLFVGLWNVSKLVSFSPLLISSTSPFLRVLPSPYFFNWNASGLAIALETKLQQGLPCRPSCCGPCLLLQLHLSSLSHMLRWNQSTSYSPLLYFLYLLDYWPFPSQTSDRHTLTFSAFSPGSFLICSFWA